MRIEIGTFTNTILLRNALDKAGNTISDLADDILNKTTLSQSKQILNLVDISVNELGFPKYAEFEQIHNAALDQGLELCPAEVGPQLRLQYTDQPDLPSEYWLRIAMQPIENLLFTVGHYRGVRYLNARSCERPNDFFEPGCRFVFVQCR